MFNFWQFFQGTVFLYFTKLVAVIHSLTDTVFISEQDLQPWLCICNAFDRYFYLRRIVTSKEHMQPYIWVVPPLFQEATCKDLVFSRVLSFFEWGPVIVSVFKDIELICLQLHPFIQRMVLFLLSKSSCSHKFFQIYRIFSEQEEL